jgi:hypothetical protein
LQSWLDRRWVLRTLITPRQVQALAKYQRSELEMRAPSSTAAARPKRLRKTAGGSFAAFWRVG